MQHALELNILPQPTETSCGPTCLHSVYRYFGESIDLHDVIKETGRLRWGGTLAVLLACHALKRGYRATIHTFNLEVFDPTWFEPAAGVGGRPVDLKAKLKARLKAKKGKRLKVEVKAYLEFLDLGGRIVFDDLTPAAISNPLRRGVPVLAGLSATYLYRQPREYGRRFEPDDVRGDPAGHFVVICGHDPERQSVLVADPLNPNPPFESHYYEVDMDRVICSILLGVLTYDANMLIIEPGAPKD